MASLRKAISAGRYAPGQKLNEEVLSAEYTSPATLCGRPSARWRVNSSSPASSTGACSSSPLTPTASATSTPPAR
nr:hypothetical protein [Corynebacterium guangdongense]